MKKMLKRADGSTSQRGLWDNIRAKAASNKKTGKKGKAPSKAMLEQEKKINTKRTGGPGDQGKPEEAASDKTSVKVNPPLPTYYRAKSDAKEKLKTAKDLYQANPTKTFKDQVDKFKSSKWLEESKELKFGGPSKRKYLVGGPETTPTMTPQQALTEMGAGRMTGAQANAATGYGNKPKKYTNAENIDNLKKVFVGSHTVDAQGNIAAKPKKPMADISTAGLRPTAPAESTTAYTRRLKSGGKKKMGGKNC